MGLTVDEPEISTAAPGEITAKIKKYQRSDCVCIRIHRLHDLAAAWQQEGGAALTDRPESV